MQRFNYFDRNEPGKILGQIDARDADDALRRLADRGVDTLRMSVVPSKDEVKRQRPDEPAPRLSRDEAAELGDQLLGLLQAKLPLARGLRAIAAETRSRRLARGLVSMASQLERGQSLETALERLNGALPAPLASLIDVGARDGTPGSVLLQHLDYRQRLDRLVHEARLVSLYPLCIIVTLIVVCVLFVLLVGEATGEFLEDFQIDYGMPVPTASQLLASMSRHGASLLIGTSITAATAAALWRLSLPRAVRHRTLKLVPLFGPLWRFIELAQWSKLLALLLDASVQLPRALRTSAEALSDADLQAAARHAAEAIEQGDDLGAAVARSHSFPPSVGPILAWAGEARQLPETLHAAAELFEARARRQIWLLEVVLPAVAFLMVIWCVAFIVAATLAPMVSLIRMLN